MLARHAHMLIEGKRTRHEGGGGGGGGVVISIGGGWLGVGSFRHYKRVFILPMIENEDHKTKTTYKQVTKTQKKS
jgi:hypothetical protein